MDKKNQPTWFLSFEVSLGAFIKTQDTYEQDVQLQAFRSYNSKRVDFLLIDNCGNPQCVIEYNGSGHYLSENAKERMQVKALALKKISILLIEVPENATKAEFFKFLKQCL